METTTNYGLKKPAQEDFVNVDDINYNSDILDEKLSETEQKAENAKVTVTHDTENEALCISLNEENVSGGGYSESEIPDISKIKVNENTYNLKDVKARETANAALPAKDYTAADILNKLKTVDGAGSGLDADLFKGQSVVPAANGGTGRESLDDFVMAKIVPLGAALEDISTAGIYRVFGGDTQFSDWPEEIGSTYKYGVLSVEVDTLGKSHGYCVQRLILTSATTSGTKIWTRFKNNNGGKYTAWVKEITSEEVLPVENGGTGSNTIQQAQHNMFGGASTVAAETDLNTLVTPGLYVCTGDATAKTLINTPFEAGKEHAFGIVVIRASAGVAQLLFTWHDGHGYYTEMFMRSQYPSNFDNGGWVKVIGTNNIEREMENVFSSSSIPSITVASDTSYTTAKVRNIQASTTDLTAGTSALANGDIYLVYE